MLIPRPNVPAPVVEEDEAPRSKAKPKTKKKTKLARSPSPRVVASSAGVKSEEEIRRILCGTDCPDFTKMGDLRAFNERRAREAEIRKAFGFDW